MLYGIYILPKNTYNCVISVRLIPKVLLTVFGAKQEGVCTWTSC